MSRTMNGGKTMKKVFDSPWGRYEVEGDESVFNLKVVESGLGMAGKPVSRQSWLALGAKPEDTFPQFVKSERPSGGDLD
jgi:hypothetical protein